VKEETSEVLNLPTVRRKEERKQPLFTGGKKSILG
jgi:hypothetical protein